MPIRILLADDHTVLRETVGHLLEYKREDVYKIVAEAEDAVDALHKVSILKPDLLLLDFKMRGMDRLSTFCRTVRDRSPITHILVLSGYCGEGIAQEAAMGGAQGYILKGSPFADLIKAIDTVQGGGVWVDERLPPGFFVRFSNSLGGRTESLNC